MFRWTRAPWTSPARFSPDFVVIMTRVCRYVGEFGDAG